MFMAASVKPASTSRRAAPCPTGRALRKSQAPLACCRGRPELTASGGAPRQMGSRKRSGRGGDGPSRRAEEECGPPCLDHRAIGAEEVEARLPRVEVVQIAVADVEVGL